jgi:hypothetical protein
MISVFIVAVVVTKVVFELDNFDYCCINSVNTHLDIVEPGVACRNHFGTGFAEEMLANVAVVGSVSFGCNLDCSDFAAGCSHSTNIGCCGYCNFATTDDSFIGSCYLGNPDSNSGTSCCYS